MKIAYVITRADSVGGASIHVRDMAQAMQQAGHEATVVIGGRGPVTDLLSDVPVVVLEHMQRAIHPLRDVQAYRELHRVLRQLSPDLVSAHTAKAGWLARAACRRLGIPVIYTPHGWAISDRISGAQGSVYAAAERIAAPWSAAIVCVSEYEKRLALEKRVAEPERLHVIHNGVRDTPHRARPGAGGRVRIVSIARFEAPKDHQTLLRALAHLQDLDWELHLIGDGPDETRIRALAGELGLGGRVHFKGYTKDPAQELAASHLFVLSSRSEGFPRSILEALRAGLPVIASDVGGIREAIQTALFPAGDVDALSAELKCMILNRLERQLQGESGRLIYQTRFRFELMFDATVGLYATVLRRAPRAS